MNYAGAKWLDGQLTLKQKPLSEFGALVADLLGDVLQGIYHADPSPATFHWDDNKNVSIHLYGTMATFDSDTLTRLVVLCHDRCVRCEIEGKGFHYLSLRFGRRARDGDGWQRHPTLEEAAAAIRQDTAREREARP